MLYNVPVVGMSWVELPAPLAFVGPLAFWGAMLAMVSAVWMVVDTAAVPGRAWRAAGRARFVWALVPVAALLAGAAVALGITIYYALAVRPGLVRAAGLTASVGVPPLPRLGPFR